LPSVGGNPVAMETGGFDVTGVVLSLKAGELYTPFSERL